MTGFWHVSEDEVSVPLFAFLCIPKHVTDLELMEKQAKKVELWYGVAFAPEISPAHLPAEGTIALAFAVEEVETSAFDM